MGAQEYSWRLMKLLLLFTDLFMLIVRAEPASSMFSTEMGVDLRIE